MIQAISWVLAATLVAISPGAFAQSYPSKPVKLVVPQAVGGATDVFARHLAQKLTLAWSQPVVVENRVGAAGVLGTDFVA
ncbi:MAG: tripartite tricarboxylate transporter substrate binding protein, partial [Betaproteobacteria bacterium]|nr:tripartite tricarboxylate transporter substrate binding protein [Betaproteobacteria bacterium]